MNLILNGAQICGQGDKVAVINPANEEIIVDIASATIEQVNESVNIAVTAFKSWKNTDDKRIKKILSAWLKLLIKCYQKVYVI
jgi:acyl-CoA reductase-like NAD-dependent aldehyde dehydrogenase